jgi:hypothetical protein
LRAEYFLRAEEIDLEVHVSLGQHEGLTDAWIGQCQFLKLHGKEVYLCLIARRDVRGDAEGPLPRRFT